MDLLRKDTCHATHATETEASSLEGKQENESTAFDADGKPFDFSAFSDLLNDPSIQTLAKQIANDPAFRNMAGELQCSIQPCGERNSPNVSSQDYLNTMQKVMDNPQFMNMAERLSSELMQDPISASILQNLRSLDQKDEVDVQRAQVQNSSSLRPIVDEIEIQGPEAVLRCIDDPDVLAMLGNALGGSFARELTSRNELNGTSSKVSFQDRASGKEIGVDFSIHDAVSTGDMKALLTLLEKGADLTGKDEEGRLALHLACGYGELACAKVLLEAEAPVDSLDRNNNTALHYASGFGKQDCVELLLKYGAAVTRQNLDGKTPSEVAKLNNQTEVMKLLEKYAFL